MRRICFLLTTVGLLFACSPKMSQTGNSTTSYKINTIAFYNLENVFDTVDDPHKNDQASPIMEMPASLRPEVYRKKISNMAMVLAQIGADVAKNAPAIIGIAEVENRAVIEDIVNDPHLKDKHYGIVHYPSPDERSIDVALIYQKALFTPISSSAHEVVTYRIHNKSKRDYTRDVLLVTGILDGDTINITVNHWPSRYGGEKRSQPARVAAAKVNRHIVDSLLAVNPYAKIIIMGDLNDNPYDYSVEHVLGAKGEKKNVGPKDLYDPMKNMLLKQGLGSLGYRDSWDLFDQIIVSKALIRHQYSSYQLYKAGIYNPDYLLTPRGEYQGYPFRSFSDGHFTGGYSDHLPVYIYLVKAE